MAEQFRNTKKQGDAGVGAAIFYFTLIGHTVCVPLTDSQAYDIIVDGGNKLDRVQIKATTYKRYGAYCVSLTVKGGNRTGAGKISKLDRSLVDSVFITTPENYYHIPVEAFSAVTHLTLTPSYDQYIVHTTNLTK